MPAAVALSDVQATTITMSDSWSPVTTGTFVGRFHSHYELLPVHLSTCPAPPPRGGVSLPRSRSASSNSLLSRDIARSRWGPVVSRCLARADAPGDVPRGLLAATCERPDRGQRRRGTAATPQGEPRCPGAERTPRPDSSADSSAPGEMALALGEPFPHEPNGARARLPRRLRSQHRASGPARSGSRVPHEPNGARARHPRRLRLQRRSRPPVPSVAGRIPRGGSHPPPSPAGSGFSVPPGRTPGSSERSSSRNLRPLKVP